MLEIKSAVVVFFLSLQNNVLCGGVRIMFRGVSTMHNFSCMCNTVCMRVMYLVITMHAITDSSLKFSMIN